MDDEGHTVGPPTERPQDIRERTLEYALRAVRLHQALRQCGDRAGAILGEQYLRSATSVGANVQEAQSGESRADFIHKYSIAQKEARESLYWLKVIERSGLLSATLLAPMIRETGELLAIITTIILNAKRKDTC